MHLHLASHLGTLDEPHEGRDIGAKPEDGRTPGVHARTGDAHQASVV